MLKRNLITISVALAILILSLTGSDSFDGFRLIDIPFLDKLVHAGMYFILAGSVIFENRKMLTGVKELAGAMLIPFFFGALMELLQMILTDSRKGEFSDIFFNLLGILAAAAIWFLIRKSGGKIFR